MGNEESILPAPSYAILNEGTSDHPQIVPIDQRDIPREWKREGFNFVYFVDTTIADRRDTMKKVIFAAASHSIVLDNPRDAQFEFLQDSNRQVSVFIQRFEIE